MTGVKPSTLAWEPHPSVPEELRRHLMGPGGPFEMAEQVVLGTPQKIFARRLPHLRALLEDGAAAFGSDPWLVHPEGELTFSQAASLIARTAAMLARIGVRRGDRIALAAPTSYEHVIAAWAVVVSGATVVGLNGWWTGAEMEYGISLTRPKLLIGDGPNLARLENRLPGLHRIDIDEIPDSWSGPDTPLPSTPIDEDDPFVILFTSRTTGRPKAAVLSHRNNLHWT